MSKKSVIKIANRYISANQVGEREIECEMSDGSTWKYSTVRKDWIQMSPATAELQKSFDERE